MGCTSSKHDLSVADLEFLKLHTSYSEKKIKAWYKGFMRDCPNGELTRESFIQIYKQFFPKGRAENFCEHVFRAFDTDKSGKIDFKEFLQAINITSQGTPDTKLEMAFRMYDCNGDGSIDDNEMRRIITAIYELIGDEIDQPERQIEAEERAMNIFTMMDKNSDGILSREEFIGGCLNDEQLYQLLTQSSRLAEERESQSSLED
ncbi:unnamed protein product [Rotaria socialis]|uniref:EF-hand domain-containing protein n=2 Tax=Rotaria socialis TaxID=392032 RepID=A0A820BYM7_9BILA|nr:unnamed protein product [Rotaria socialis]CAF3323556.1 unnamed protein product [Rotaria socialis]CAF3419705.1 unnamed protein product [Rotaria socialis]CAF4208402.1 unnamed protein product [Rotaria socialis]CAF4215174.1 unnamed protein product [Rotaria socialis]